MREEFEPYLQQYITVEGIFIKTGYRKEDGHKKILWEDPESKLTNPIRRFPPGVPIYKGFFGDDIEYENDNTSLIHNLTMNGNIVGDGHLWLTEDITLRGFVYGNKVKISGQVEKYRKNNGDIDYCIDRPTVELI